MAELGFPVAGLDAAGAVLQAGVADRLWPGAVALAGSGDAVQRNWVFGDAENWPGGRRPMAEDTVFDLASLTKMLVTTPAVLLLAQDGLIALTDPAARYLPGMDPRIEICQLLQHVAGFPPEQDLTAVRSTAELVAGAAAEPLVAEPGRTVAYSDLGFIVLGGLIEKVSGQPLAEFAVERLFEPLAIEARFRP
ncbi:MAG: serine hydrolase domain-containing protein, partial [Jatrophihabitantaceae bacterium]